MDPAAPKEPDPLFSRFAKQFAAGQVIFREGDPGGEAYLLQEGRVRLIKNVRSVEHTLMIAGPGDLFGESAFVAGARRSSTAVALSDGKALALEPSLLGQVFEQSSALPVRLVLQLARRLRDAEDQIEIMMLHDAQSKIVDALLKLAQYTEVGADGAAQLQVSPMELSTRVGLDVETVKRGMQKLRAGEYVRVVDEKVEIPDVESLRRLFSLLGVKDAIQGGDLNGDANKRRE